MKQIALTTILALFVFTMVAPVAQADYLLDRSGTLTAIDGSILGDEDIEVETEDLNSDSTESQESNIERQNEAQKQRIEKQREQAKKNLERQIEARKKTSEMNDLKSKVELKTEAGKFKLKQETKDKFGRTTSKEIELKPGESLHVEDQEGEGTLELKLKEERKEQRDEEREERQVEQQERLEAREQKLEIIKNQIKTETNLPIKIDENNQLLITRPDGSTKVVTVLPDQAVENMRRRGIVVEGDTTTPELTENESGALVYKVDQEVERRILGMRLKFKRATEVSAESGEVEVTSLETNPIKKWLERFVD